MEKLDIPAFRQKIDIMFFYQNWETFCEWLRNQPVTVCTAEQSLRLAEGTRFVVLKHDVECSLFKAYQLAAIEHRHGLCGSFYVQAYLLDCEENVRMLLEMQRWGDEISYHYDVLDAHNGDFVAAENDFRQKLLLFGKYGFRFTTICQHGNPVKNRIGYTSNRDFFRNETIRKHYPNLVDLVVNYSKYARHDYGYISDVGYSWNIITEPETNDLHPEVENVRLNGFAGLKEQIARANCGYIISTHPHRWNHSAIKAFMKIAAFRLIRNSVRMINHIPGAKSVMNRFYYLAKLI